jgi:hypothetical protein
MATTYPELNKRQEQKFNKIFEELLRWVELQRPDDYYPGMIEDGLYMGDVRSQRIEFVIKDQAFDLVLTCRRTH